MADDEQFSLCWNNFNSNLSAGFHESLCRGDLVDVTLAAEGQFVKAHRLVLSVCSPYFRKMFTQMPANQHAFVFLKDVSHTALKDLIQFMYCGEVNVKQEALPAFISTAEALQIKGLTDSDPPQSQTPPEPSTPTPQIQQIATSPRVRQRTSTSSRSYKIENVDDAVDDGKSQTTQIVIQTTAAPPQATIVHHAPQQQHHMQTTTQATQQIVTAAPTTQSTVVTHKRPAQRNASAPHIKRTKSTIETIDSNETTNATTTQVQPQQITVQTAVVTTDSKGHQPAETEYIDLPMDLPTKSEPEYADEAGDVDGTEQDGTYVEDDAYADIRYDESYFTENEDGGGNVTTGTTTVSTPGSTVPTTSKAVIKQQQQSFSDSSYVDGGAADQGNNDAQADEYFAKAAESSSDSSGDETANENVEKKLIAQMNDEERSPYADVVSFENSENSYMESIVILENKHEQVAMETDTQNSEQVNSVESSVDNIVSTDNVESTNAVDEQSVGEDTGSNSNETFDTSDEKIYVGNKRYARKIPLYPGCRVCVSKTELKQIFIPNAAIYTMRLTEVVFGIETLTNVAMSKFDEKLQLLDQRLLTAIISHVIQLFRPRKIFLQDADVREYILRKLELIKNPV